MAAAPQAIKGIPQALHRSPDKLPFVRFAAGVLFQQRIFSPRKILRTVVPGRRSLPGCGLPSTM